MKIKDPTVLILAMIDKKRLNQRQVAKRIGMQNTQFNEILKGKRNISGKVAFRLQDAIGVSAEQILRMQFENELAKLKQVRKLRK